MHRDYYTELLEESRWMSPQQSAARTAWIRSLPMKNKEKLVFELEMTLKGLVCLGSPFNHPGPKKRTAPACDRDFAKELTLARDAVHHVVTTGRLLGVAKDNAPVFQRYRRSVIAQDQHRYDIVREALAQITPDKSLALLVSTLHYLLEVIDGLSHLHGVSYTLFKSVIQAIEIKIHSSVFFNPLAALEFRPEFDSLRPDSRLELIKEIKSDPARRVTVITVLAMERLLRYMDMIDAAPSDEEAVEKQVFSEFAKWKAQKTFPHSTKKPKGVSFDFAVAEPLGDNETPDVGIVVIPGGFPWTDIGSFKAIFDHCQEHRESDFDNRGNLVLVPENVTVKGQETCRRCLIFIGNEMTEEEWELWWSEYGKFFDIVDDPQKVEELIDEFSKNISNESMEIKSIFKSNLNDENKNELQDE